MPKTLTARTVAQMKPEAYRCEIADDVAGPGPHDLPIAGSAVFQKFNQMPGTFGPLRCVLLPP